MTSRYPIACAATLHIGCGAACNARTSSTSPASKKLDHALIDAVVQTRPREFQCEDRHIWRGGPIVLRLELADRPASQLEHLECADNPAAVVGMKAGRRPWVERGQSFVERGIAVLEGVVL